jgi:hypothetical protein
MEAIDLHEFIENNKNINVIDKEVVLGEKERISVRLVGIRLPRNVADERKRKAKKDRNKKTNHSKKYLDLLGWSFFITNVPKEIWKPRDITIVYGYRWRIEIIFRAWKSGFKMSDFFKKVPSMTLPRAYISLYLFLA